MEFSFVGSGLGDVAAERLERDLVGLRSAPPAEAGTVTPLSSVNARVVRGATDGS